LNNPLIFLPFFALMWFGIQCVLSYMSGWKQLAYYYPYNNQMIDKKKDFQWANVGGISYKGCMTIGGNNQGLYLSILPLFSFCSAKLFIPWNDIKTAKKKYWWFPVLELSINQTPTVKIMFLQSMEKFLQEIYGRPLLLEGA
jgi:hypothetical protein